LLQVSVRLINGRPTIGVGVDRGVKAGTLGKPDASTFDRLPQTRGGMDKIPRGLP
jgi:hypothetical protein